LIAFADDLYQNFCTGNASLDYTNVINDNSCYPIGQAETDYLNRADVQVGNVSLFFFSFVFLTWLQKAAIHAAESLAPGPWSACSQYINYNANGNSLVPKYQNFQRQKPGFKVFFFLRIPLSLTFFVTKQIIGARLFWRRRCCDCSNVADVVRVVASQLGPNAKVGTLVCERPNCWILVCVSRLHICFRQGSWTCKKNVSSDRKVFSLLFRFQEGFTSQLCSFLCLLLKSFVSAPAYVPISAYHMIKRFVQQGNLNDLAPKKKLRRRPSVLTQGKVLRQLLAKQGKRI
jgi:hypothetical protein